VLGDAKAMFAAAVLPKSQLRRIQQGEPLPSWPNLLVSAVVVTVLQAAWRAAVLAALVWVIHRYWWHGLPGLGYLPAVAIMFLVEFLRPDGSRVVLSSVPPSSDPGQPAGQPAAGRAAEPGADRGR
jgi:hypothetical protein